MYEMMYGSLFSQIKIYVDEELPREWTTPNPWGDLSPGLRRFVELTDDEAAGVDRHRTDAYRTGNDWHVSREQHELLKKKHSPPNF